MTILASTTQRIRRPIVVTIESVILSLFQTLLTLEMNFRTSKHLPATEKVSKSKTQEGTPLSTCDMNRDYFSIMKTEKPKFEIILEVKLPLFYRQPHHPRLLLLPPTSSTNLHLVSFLSIFSNAPLS
ncbi:hypothetical protein WN943_021516 [Citrus x changshan-huyou]